MRLVLPAAALLAALAFAHPARADAPAVSAHAFLVVDARSGEVLAQHAAGMRLPIASITKLMTVIITLQRAHLDDVVVVQHEAANVGESSIGLRAGERISVRDLLKAALIQSANDAADALADYVGHGDVQSFVRMMNREARALGLRRTHFARPDGLDAPQHYSSARDVIRLAETAMRYRAVRSIVRERTDEIEGGRTLHTWNDLLGVFRGLVGVKTGHTGAAGWCEVAEVKRDGLDLYATVLGSPTRAQRNADLAALLRWATDVERPAWVIVPGRAYARPAVGYGRGSLPLVPANPLLRTVRTDRPLVEVVTAPSAVSLPVRRGETVGTVAVFSGRRLLGRSALVAARSVSAPNAGGRARFYLSHAFDHVRGWFA